MSTKIFVNLPVGDPARAMAFFKALGFSVEPTFTDETAACFVITPSIYLIVMTPKRFADFTKKEIANAHETTEVITALTPDSRAAVDAMMDKALAAGATQARPADDHGFIYARSFADPDGHIWEVLWMDPAKLPA
jgi:hypothetical protein